jgi:hypothetical protein
MRRRLTVTGSSQNIDGSVKPGVAPSGDLKKYKGSKSDQVSSVSVSASQSSCRLVTFCLYCGTKMRDDFTFFVSRNHKILAYISYMKINFNA